MSTLGWFSFTAMLVGSTSCIVFGIRQLAAEDDAIAMLCCLTGALLLRAAGKSLDSLEGSRS